MPNSLKDVKYIFVTGGVCSSLGKGIAAASLGSLLELRGLKISLQKIDPYLNVDAGSMSPFQHGEIFVTDDGGETDLDLGNYERFTDAGISKYNNITTGQIYSSVIKKEREGEYLGKTVQVIPHITNEIKHRIKLTAKKSGCDILIVELGGTIGDIEGIPFVEAIRQFSLEVKKENVLFIHLTLVPYIGVSGELKTKPTQHSVKELGSMGIVPDIIMCRSSLPLAEDMREKIALLCNTDKESVIQALDIDSSIYEIPIQYHKEGLDKIVTEKLKLKTKPLNLSRWQEIVQALKNAQDEVHIGVIGKYVSLSDSYKSLYEALAHGGIAHKIKVKIHKFDPENYEVSQLEAMDGVLIPGGFGHRGMEGKIKAIQYARQSKKPLLGLCLGMQLMVIEFARNVLGLKEADSHEFSSNTPHPVISMMKEKKEALGLETSMRLGAYKAILNPQSKLYAIYGKKEKISERHRHRFEFNNAYQEKMEKKGLIIGAVCEEGGLVEEIELPNHPWAIGVQYHPEYKSKPYLPHPLFGDFIKTCLAQKQKK